MGEGTVGVCDLPRLHVVTVSGSDIGGCVIYHQQKVHEVLWRYRPSQDCGKQAAKTAKVAPAAKPVVQEQEGMFQV